MAGVRRALAAGAIYFVAVFAAGFVLGVLRTLWVAPMVGPMLAVAVELPLILAVAWIACVRVLRRLPLGRGGEAALMGASAFALLMLAEAGVSIGLGGRSLAQHLALYAEAPHLLGLAGQVVFACIPALQVRRREGYRSAM
jgi:ABC-type uncharacterized transport system permease subunit